MQIFLQLLGEISVYSAPCFYATCQQIFSEDRKCRCVFRLVTELSDTLNNSQV